MPQELIAEKHPFQAEAELTARRTAVTELLDLVPVIEYTVWLTCHLVGAKQVTPLFSLQIICYSQ